MVTDKKPSKPVSKVPKKSTSKKSQQKTLKLVKSSNQLENIPFLSNLLAPNIEPPDGFLAISASQAIMEYAGPLMEMVSEPEDIVKANEIFQIAPAIWNYTLNDNLKKKEKTSKAETLTLIHKKLGLDINKADEFFSMMVERKQFLFPSDVQPKGSPVIFMRKTVSYLIKRFDYENLKLSTDIIDVNKSDLRVLKILEKLDQYILKSADYDKYEKLFLKAQEECPDRFYVWLGDKGIEEYQYTFAYLSNVYITFIYGYAQEEPVTLKSGPGKYFVAFMVDFLLRKAQIEPWEYTLCPTAMRLFYKFLYEKEYLLEPPDMMMEFIDRLATVLPVKHKVHKMAVSFSA